MPKHHEWIVTIDDDALQWPFKHIFRMLHDVLVDRRVDANEYAEGIGSTAPGASRLLQKRVENAWIPDDDTGIEHANIDSQFQGSRCTDS